MPLVPSESVPLAPMTTLRAGGSARHFVEARTETDVLDALAWAASRGSRLYVLGGGSNVVVADTGVDGLVVRVALKGLELRDESSSGVELRAAAGEPWDDVVRFAVERGFSGVECLSGIPGSVGATPIQNVGAYGQDVSQTIASVRVLDRESLAVMDMSNRDCGFGYRDSVFKSRSPDRFVVLAVSYRLGREPRPRVSYPDLQRELAKNTIGNPSLADVRASVLAVRRSKSMVLDPNDPNSRSCGSFFLNPVVTLRELARIRKSAETDDVPSYPQGGDAVKLSAAWLIERAGFRKGQALGDAGISERHSLALVCRRGSRTAEVVELARLIREGVADRFGVTLVPEPSFWGFPHLQTSPPRD